MFASGKPVITSLTKQRSGDAQHKLLVCEAEGVPEPQFQWSVNCTTVRVLEAQKFLYTECYSHAGFGKNTTCKHDPLIPPVFEVAKLMWSSLATLCGGC